MVEFSSQVLGTINKKSQRNDRGKCLGWPVTSYGADVPCVLDKINRVNLTPDKRSTLFTKCHSGD